MGKSIIELMMNPVKLRIVQYLLIHETGTVGEIRGELTDVPPASLYRHIKALSEAGCLAVAEERRVRGTVEKVYCLEKNPMGEPGKDEIKGAFISGLLSLITSFQQYFDRPDCDPQGDMLALSTSALLLSDEEFIDFQQKLGEVFNQVIFNTPAPGRKTRRLTLISSPCEGEKEDEKEKENGHA